MTRGVVARPSVPARYISKGSGAARSRLSPLEPPNRPRFARPPSPARGEGATTREFRRPTDSVIFRRLPRVHRGQTHVFLYRRAYLRQSGSRRRRRRAHAAARLDGGSARRLLARIRLGAAGADVRTPRP